MKKFLTTNKKYFIYSGILLTLTCLSIFIWQPSKDDIALKLIGDAYKRIDLYDEYKDLGIEVFINEEKVEVEYDTHSNLDTNTPGIYEITYSYQKVEIKRIVEVVDLSLATLKERIDELENNEIIAMTWSNNGFNIIGKTDKENYHIVLRNKERPNLSYLYSTKIKNDKFNTNINLSNLPNGTYQLLYKIGDNEEYLINNLDGFDSIARAKINNKLVTFNYNEQVEFTISDHEYKYDILINPGHGGNDPGAVNRHIYESHLNLIVSLYEKQRFESHGLRVFMTRETNDTYGILMGDVEWRRPTRSAFAIGYYGVVSRISYSNHHNSSELDFDYNGWEIIVAASLSKEELALEHKIADIWDDIYPLHPTREPQLRFYTRNFYTRDYFSKREGQRYSFKSFYAMNRIPLQLFNVKTILFEGCYMNHEADFKWYYLDGNWKTISEAKIKVYVESLGITYMAP